MTTETYAESNVQKAIDRRQNRRHDLDLHDVSINRFDGNRSEPLGVLVDLSSGGMKFKTREKGILPDQQIRLSLVLPAYAGISPFIDTTGERIRPKNEWSGWVSVARVNETDSGEYEIGGRMIDMEPLDRGMLSLYLSTHPLS